MKSFLPVLFCSLFLNVFQAIAQTSIIVTDSVAQQVMLGNYDPSAYFAIHILNNPDTISKGISANVSPDSLHTFVDSLIGFQNRNTGSDTISATKGIGAARRWAYSKFQQFSAENENRLIPSYLQFDMAICGINRHKDVFAVLPGMDTTDKSIIIIEGHLDSRSQVLCDTASIAQGADDNSSGSALVLELARVMSRYSYSHTIVFLLTTGEEQGLYGAAAFAVYAFNKKIQVKAVMNNDIVGGVFCGHTSSAPSCPGFGNIDSTHVRLFSFGGFNSSHKGLARYIKLEYNERVRPYALVPMTLNVMTPEDRTGRSGDQMPFKSYTYTAMRFTSANEDGDADVTDTSYSDRQHTSGDILGIDTKHTGTIDSFFVDFDYLSRNTVINGNAAGMMAISPSTPDFTIASGGPNTLIIKITQEEKYLNYKVGLRTKTYDWDSVYSFKGTLVDTINVPAGNYIASVASVDGSGVESLFSREQMIDVTSVNNVSNPGNGIELLQNSPNPSDEATMISVVVNRPINYKDAYISIRDITGREVKHLGIQLKQGVNEVLYEHGYHASGTFIYTLVIDGAPVQSKKMIFMN
ncbi:MAG TPA: M28 family peptidase [Flavipsychrobacter sp.]|nr:M28 family peptidase [Flavipsychrobacter sp.]